VKRAVSFLCESVRLDGSWPIDTNLATWTTTLSINALKDHVPDALRHGLSKWLLDQHYKEVHPFTNAAPGGWAWTDLPGGVPDADDTPGAMLAVMQLRGKQATSSGDVALAVESGTEWLINLQNRDGGFPTFCRGWGTLPFDRSSPDITAHCLRAIHELTIVYDEMSQRRARGFQSINSGLKFLKKKQRPNGSWVPLWFGNQFAENDENPVYGTSRVLMAYRDLGMLDAPEAQKAAAWLASVQHTDPDPDSSPGSHYGGWGGNAEIEPSVEETALAVEVLLEFDSYRKNAFDGISWLIDKVVDGSVSVPTPIGFYFARLWYFEGLYPLIFTVSALRRAVEISESNPA
jgi:squalene-hopene/tetraprenyl-beta-curcumene cyclase